MEKSKIDRMTAEMLRLFGGTKGFCKEWLRQARLAGDEAWMVQEFRQNMLKLASLIAKYRKDGKTKA
jgi:hypothetical protein